MPTYEYACTTCGQHVEVFQRFAEAPLETCGACGGPLRKVFHPAGIVFKGSGFYATDNRSKPKSETSGAKKDGSSRPSSSGDSSAGSSSGSGDSSSGDSSSGDSSSGSSSSGDGASKPAAKSGGKAS